PSVEVAYDRDLLGIGAPDGKVGARRAVAVANMGPQLFVNSVVATFSQETKIVVGQKRRRDRCHGPGSPACRLAAMFNRIQGIAGSTCINRAVTVSGDGARTADSTPVRSTSRGLNRNAP